ncbi:TIGR03083 family protein [Klenkia soli]|uniref:TIGR03083 family protein n=1 Tax=Klenkia soli TaxID=1052260 RepID=A0A1H0SEP3_9ACTN|nr:maleylpyruvate isomerase family mycothiol-dependent enzyme [Klenkia soli]SDP39979.1 TIGR03083 family protein [Klenkia soli]
MELSDAAAIEEWTQAQARVIALVADLPAADVARRVPACPDWTVHDLVAHVVGVDADVLSGDEADDHNSGWTQAQVDARAGRGIGALIEEWHGLTEPLRAWMAEHGTRPMGDVVMHEQDLRGALGTPGAHDTPAMAQLRDRFAARVADAVAEAGLPPIALVGSTWRTGPEDAEVVLTASDFDLARAVQSRRSADQLRAWTTRGDVGRYLACFETLGPLPARPLSDGATSSPG